LTDAKILLNKGDHLPKQQHMIMCIRVYFIHFLFFN